MPKNKAEVLAALSQLSPEHLAEPWDNVGLLVDPGARGDFTRAFVTIDLTKDTMHEADELGADLIIAYHPPIFSGLKRLRAEVGSESLVVHALRAGMTIYSPHTALDAVPGGMNDWLARALGPGKTVPIVPHVADETAGSGRLVDLETPLAFDDAVARVKKHLGLAHVRVAEAADKRAVRTFGVCPGAGGSVFEKVREADLLLTGEMRHHDVLARRSRGTHVILTDHTNTERGFLPHYAEQIRAKLPGLEVTVSSVDADPLRVS